MDQQSYQYDQEYMNEYVYDVVSAEEPTHHESYTPPMIYLPFHQPNVPQPDWSQPSPLKPTSEGCAGRGPLWPVTNWMRRKASKGLTRYIRDGYDLNLVYITHNVIAMGFPISEGKDLYFRNRMEDVEKFFDTKHPQAHRIYNLRVEKAYDPRHFHGNCVVYGWFDHHSPPLGLLVECVTDLYQWVFLDPKKNVGAVHCTAGKGRTGVVIAAYLLHSQSCHSASEAMKTFGSARSANGSGVDYPSQRRYVQYYQSLVQNQQLETLPSRTALINGVTLSSAVKPTMILLVQRITYHDGKQAPPVDLHEPLIAKKASDNTMFFEFTQPLPVQDDLRIVIGVPGVKKPMFWVSFHLAFGDEDGITFTKEELDGPHRDKKCKTYPTNFSLTVHTSNIQHRSSSYLVS